MVTKGLNKITQNETQDPHLVDNFCKSWVNKITQNETQDLQLVDNFGKSWVGEEKNSHSGAGEGTRTLTPKAPEPKSGASTNFATPAY